MGALLTLEFTMPKRQKDKFDFYHPLIEQLENNRRHLLSLDEWIAFVRKYGPNEYHEAPLDPCPAFVTISAKFDEDKYTETQLDAICAIGGGRYPRPYIDVMSEREFYGMRFKHPDDYVLEENERFGLLGHHLDNGASQTGRIINWPMYWLKPWNRKDHDGQGTDTSRRKMPSAT